MAPMVGERRGGPVTSIWAAAVIVTVEKDWIQTSPPEPEPPPPPLAWAVLPVCPRAWMPPLWK